MKSIYRLTIFTALLLSTCTIFAQNRVRLLSDSTETIINKNIYGHFAEHLGRCIYGGIFVGKENTTIPNTNGIRNDVIVALKELQVPVLRWPGGCFADWYHWKEAIGPQSERSDIENVPWDYVREDNSFGTHEFLDFCELIGAKPYLAMNMNTGSVQEGLEWVQYTCRPKGSNPMADLRVKNGREEPWGVKYWGIGNESWGCGGNMNADYYSNLYKRFATAITDYTNTPGYYRIAVGPGDPNYNWTETIMKNVPLNLFEGLSVHHYSVISWVDMGPSQDFSQDIYFRTMERAWKMKEFVEKNSEVMDKYDPEKKIGLVVDEWGGWYSSMKEKGLLYQQNTIRDAMIAGLTLNIFNNHADRVKMANLAQMTNVLQALILTENEKMLLTPTYHVMKMYNVHQDATLVPIEVESETFTFGDKEIQAVSVSASKNKQGILHISLTNIDNTKGKEVEIQMNNYNAKNIKGTILTSEKVQDCNTFENPNAIVPVEFKDFKNAKGTLKVNMPPNSVIMLEINP